MQRELRFARYETCLREIGFSKYLSYCGEGDGVMWVGLVDAGGVGYGWRWLDVVRHLLVKNWCVTNYLVDSIGWVTG